MTPAYISQARSGVQAQMKAHEIIGAAAALIVDGELAWMEAFGETGGPTSRPVDAETIFSIQSTSKTFCATAVMLAVQRGLVDLDKPLTDYLPEFSVNSRHEPAPERRITLRHLLSHHAGFTHEAPVGNNFAYDFDGPPPDFRSHIESIQRTWLRYPVGTRYAYSNLGIDVAGHVLERVTGLSYSEVLRRWIFAPLGMNRSTADGDVYSRDPNRAVGHTPPFDRVPVRIPIVPSGGVYTSLADMVRYARFRLSRGRSLRRQVLDPALWEEMHDFRYGVYYALGIGIHELRLRDHDVAVYTHDGGGFGFGCCFYYCPLDGVAFVVLSNKGVGGNVFDSVMPDPIIEARHGPPLTPQPNPNPPAALPPDELARRVGLYMNQDNNCRATVRDRALWLAFDNGWGDNRLTFVGDHEAWVAEGSRLGETVRFHAARGLESPWFEAPEGVAWDFIDGPSVPSGSVGAQYDGWLGGYEYEVWGKRVGKAVISRKNGWLYFNDIRLAPHEPGLFFSGEGETLDLRGGGPTARNIKLFRSV